MAETLVIETTDLRKDYGGVEAVRGLNLQVPVGSIFALLGRNGAGKTSTIKILLGMSRPTSGCARVFGLAADSPDASVTIRRRTGFVSEEKDLYDGMTVEQIIMKSLYRTVTLAVGVLVLPASGLRAQTAADPSGHWVGSINIPGRTIGGPLSCRRDAK